MVVSEILPGVVVALVSVGLAHYFHLRTERRRGKEQENRLRRGVLQELRSNTQLDAWSEGDAYPINDVVVRDFYINNLHNLSSLDEIPEITEFYTLGKVTNDTFRRMSAFAPRSEEQANAMNAQITTLQSQKADLEELLESNLDE